MTAGPAARGLVPFSPLCLRGNKMMTRSLCPICSVGRRFIREADWMVFDVIAFSVYARPTADAPPYHRALWLLGPKMEDNSIGVRRERCNFLCLCFRHIQHLYTTSRNLDLMVVIVLVPGLERHMGTCNGLCHEVFNVRQQARSDRSTRTTDIE